MHSTASLGSMVRFGVFEADLRSGELRKNGTKVKIQELPFQALKLLLSRPNEVLSREDLRQTLWPEGVFVDFDRGVISAINRLRDALGDSADNPIFIETVGRRGYRWIAPTHISDPAADSGSVVAADATAEPTLKSGVDGRSKLRRTLNVATPIFLLLLLVWIFWTWRSPMTRQYLARQYSGRRTSTAPSANAAANREAEEFYLKGRYYWEKRTPESLNKAVDAFTQAIVHDPNYAQAYVGLADCYNLLREYTSMPSSEAYPRALAAARKAVELDPQSSDAHASLAFVSFYGMWDIATADREFRRAVDLNPNNAVAHHWYATYLMCLRRVNESLAEIEHARTLDPASKSVLADKGILLFNAGRQEEAIALLKQMEENEPDFISPHRFLKEIYLISGDYPHYLTEARREATLMGDGSALAISDAAEKGFATAGGPGLLDALVREQQKLYDRGKFSPLYLAKTYSIRGDKQKALDYLKIAYDQHVDGLEAMAPERAFSNLHGEPAFQRILAAVGLPLLT